MNLLFRSWVLVPVLALAQNDLHSESCTSPETCASDLKRRTLSSPDCQLYMGTSNSGGLGVFSGVNINKPTQIGRPEMVVSIIDPNKREKSLWHDFVWAADMSETLVFENKFIIDAFVPGLGTHIQCHEVSHQSFRFRPWRCVGFFRAEPRTDRDMPAASDPVASAQTILLVFAFCTLPNLHIGVVRICIFTIFITVNLSFFTIYLLTFLFLQYT